MARTDIYLDPMLRHLGVAYYESLHGQATPADVTRALDTVQDHLAEQGEPSVGTKAVRRPRPSGQRKRRVRDVMTAPVVTVNRAAQIMTANHLRRLPVVDADGGALPARPIFNS